MKAVRFHERGSPGVLRYEDAPEPKPGGVRLPTSNLQDSVIWANYKLLKID
ncbi:MAG: hypothetical protein LAN61_05060 [Acidobacteriia bacterium]|nr:hypothetical protein [Terriglobia bacterium]